MRRILALLAACAALAVAQVPQISSSSQFKDTRTNINTALVYLDQSKPNLTIVSTLPGGCTYNASIPQQWLRSTDNTLWYCSALGTLIQSAGQVGSVFGRTGSVTAQSGDYTTTQVTEGTNLYFTNARAVAALSGLYEVPLMFNGPLSRSTNTISCVVATASVPGCLAAADFATFAGKQNAITGAPGAWPSTFTPSAHAASHKSGGSDEIATTTPAAGAIPKAGSDGILPAGFVSSGTPVAQAVVVYDSLGHPTGSACSIASGVLTCTTSGSHGITLPATSGGNSFAIYGKDTQAASVCIIMPDSAPTSGNPVLSYSGSTATTTDSAARTCYVMAWSAGGSGSGLGDPGSNGIIKRTALNATAVAVAGTDFQAVISGAPGTWPSTFAPSAHASAHLSNGADPIAAASTTVRGTVTTTTATSQVVSTDDTRMTNARTPTSHASTHQNGGSDEIATATAAANAIPKAGAGGTLAPGWLPNPAASTLGGVKSIDCTGTGHILKIGTDGLPVCSADSGVGGSTLLPKYWLPYGVGYTTTVWPLSGGATPNRGFRFPLFVDAPIQFSKVWIYVYAADAGKYASLAFFSDDMATKVCETTPASVAATGSISLAISCTLAAGTYYVVPTSDSAGVAKAYGINNSVEPGAAGTDAHGGFMGWSSGAVSSGSGSSIAFSSNLTSITWTYGSYTPLAMALGQ